MAFHYTNLTNAYFAYFRDAKAQKFQKAMANAMVAYE